MILHNTPYLCQVYAQNNATVGEDGDRVADIKERLPRSMPRTWVAASSIIDDMYQARHFIVYA